jgi:16S rRNA (uracil1498-N3)-methyltransferase
MRKKEIVMTHEFALFYKNLSGHTSSTLTDTDIIHRIMHVLRKKKGDKIIFFNQKSHVSFLLKEITSKKITGILGDFKMNHIISPYIKLFMPVLKKEALSEAIYGAVECGVSEIQLVMTEKVQRKWQGQKELERLQRVVIAAAEQSKHFSLPNIHEPISFLDALNSPGVDKLLCADPEGEPISSLFCHPQQAGGKSEDLGIFLGPEGGLTEKELSELKQAQATFFKLTPTILRARQAAILSVGFLRSI